VLPLVAFCSKGVLFEFEVGGAGRICRKTGKSNPTSTERGAGRVL